MPTIAQKWMEQGEKRGVEKGIRQGVLDAIELGLELKFGAAGLRLLPQIRTIEDLDLLRAIREGIKTCNSVDELRQIYE